MTTPHAAPRLFVGVHRTEADAFPPTRDSLTALAIHAFTWMRYPEMAGKWVLGQPATHAFVVVADDENGPWRLDARPPVAEPSAYTGPDVATRLWECSGDTVAGILRAHRLRGAPYDISEMLNQGVAVVTERFPRLRIPVNYKSVAGAMICSALTCDVMSRCGGVTAAIAADVMRDDFFPEEIGQRCTGVLREVDPVTLEPLPAVRAARVHATGCPRERCECGAEVGA